MVLNKSPANHVKIMKKLNPFTLFVLMFDSICGRPKVASIDIDTNPRKGPNMGMFNV